MAGLSGHFTLSKVALGTWRPALRHPLSARTRLRPLPHAPGGPRPSPRLLDIERNNHERLVEARGQQWLGEVSALQESLRHIAGKEQQAQRLQEHADRQEVGTRLLM